MNTAQTAPKLKVYQLQAWREDAEPVAVTITAYSFADARQQAQAILRNWNVRPVKLLSPQRHTQVPATWVTPAGDTRSAYVDLLYVSDHS